MNGDSIILFIRGAGFIVAGAIGWMLYFDIKDSIKPEPRRLLVLACVLGFAAAILSMAVYGLLEWAGVPVSPGFKTVDIFLYCVIIVGPLEEGVKFLIARAIVFRWRHFDEPIDGMVYASFVAIGFAAAENFLYMPYLIWQEQLVRAVTSPLTHSLFASVWGFGTAYAILRCHGRGSRFFWQAAPLGISMLLHGLYNFFLLAMHAAYIASIIILVLWIGLIWYARRLIKTEKTQA